MLGMDNFNRFKLNGEEVKLYFGRYGNGNTSIQLYNLEGELYTTITVNVCYLGNEDIVGVKNYSVNVGVDKFLIENELVEKEVLNRIPRGYVEIPFYRLTNKAIKIRDEFSLLTDLYMSKSDEDYFPELVLGIENKILSGELSSKWVNVYEEYCKQNPPKTDNFSYIDLGELLLDKLT